MKILQPLSPPIDHLLSAYDWYDHPEGPKFVETHRDEYRTCGHWLFLKGKISAFHQVFNNEELWLIQFCLADRAALLQRFPQDFLNTGT